MLEYDSNAIGSWSKLVNVGRMLKFSVKNLRSANKCHCKDQDYGTTQTGFVF